MPDVSFLNLFAVAVIGLGVPLVLGFVPRLRVPAVVVEIVAGIVVGPAVLGLVEADTVVRVMAVLGLAFLLFLGGLEIEVDRFRGPQLRRALLAFGLSIVIAVAVGASLTAAGVVREPLFVAIVLLATSLGVVVPVLKDADETATAFGQTIIVACTVADFGAIVLLSLLFSREATSSGAQAVLLGSFALAAVAVAFGIARIEHVRRLSAILRRLQDSTAQIRVRAAFLLLAGFAALAELLGLEVILGAFLAGVIVVVVDRDEAMTHPLFRQKLGAIGFGVFIPIFFVASGLSLDVRSLLADPSSLALVPVFLAALVAVRGLPAVLYRGEIGDRAVVAGGLLQATSLPFIVAATQIGLEIGLLEPSTAAGLVAAGLLSVLLFPVSALAILSGGATGPTTATTEPHQMMEAM